MVTFMVKNVTQAATGAIIERAPAGLSSISSSRSRRRPPEVLTEPEAIALIRACSSRAPTGVRNRALIAVLWRSGLRISEALALELRDVDLEAGTLRVRHGKGDKSRTGRRRRADLGPAGPVDRSAAQALTRRAGAGVCTLAGGRVDASYVRHLLPRLAARAGLDRRVHAHGLRHTYASELARERTPINVIRDALGHTSLAVTDRYLRNVAPMHVIDTIRARRWDGA